MKPKRLSLGKLPLEVLSNTVLKMTGAPSQLVETGPKTGGDFAVIRLGRKHLVVSSDPITGVSSNIGWYAVNVSANDVSTSGNRPQFMQSVILLPEGSTEEDVRMVAAQVHRSARDLGVAIVGGHTEVTPGLERPILAVTAFSFVDRFVTSADAKAGDTIMMTKTAGLEGTAIIAQEAKRLRTKLGDQLMRRAAGLEKQLSVVDEAVAAFQSGQVHAMHDCTEGGVLGAAYEMSLVSDVGFELREKRVPLATETAAISRALGLDPLRLIGSGALLLAVARGREQEVESALSPICKVTRIGRFKREGRLLKKADGTEERIRSAPTDELWRFLGKLP